jgi:flagellar basal body-associated protein FliL
MSAKAEEAEKPAEEKPKKSKKKLIIFAVIGLVSLVGGAGVAAVFMPAEPAEEHPAEELHEPAEPVKDIQTADLGQFIVNLSDMGSFLKVRIMIEYDSALIDRQLGIVAGAEGGQAHGGGASGGAKEPAGGGIHPHLAKKEHHFRDVIIRILSAKKAPDLLTVEGKTRLKEELMDGLNEAIGLEEPPVVGILFTDFMVQ